MPTRSENLAMEKEVIGIYVSDHPLRGHERTMQQNASHSCSAVMELEDSVPVKLSGVIAKLRTILTKSEGKKMASIVLEDFTGQVSAIAFPATYEKLKDSLIKDSVVQLTGFTLHREMRGEKSIEIRIEDVRPLEASLLPQEGSNSAAGTVTINIWRATERQVHNLRQLVDDHPGDYEVAIQVMSSTNVNPLYLTSHVNPTDVFCRAVKEGLTRGEPEVEHRDGRLN